MADYLVSEQALIHNGEILRSVADAAGCRIVLALKGFSTWGCFSPLRQLLDGCCASGLWEAKLAAKHFGKHILCYSPCYKREDIPELLDISTHLDFNSLSQWEQMKDLVLSHPRFLAGEVKCGLRINPQFSTGHTPLYDPCAPGSRLGITSDRLQDADLRGISGIHFHTLCEQGAQDLADTWHAVEERFEWLLKRPEITWVNMGGGHWITKPDYDRELLIKLVQKAQMRWNVQIWLEPGEAAAIHSGILQSTVLDCFESEGIQHAILDVSASAHMPDVLEMPYRPDVFVVSPTETNEAKRPAVTKAGEHYQQAGHWGEQAHDYRLGAPTCLAGDQLGDYSFPHKLQIGDKIIFDDMAHYTMVKTSFFNGVEHPRIIFQHLNGSCEILREFHFEDFESRLG